MKRNLTSAKPDSREAKKAIVMNAGRKSPLTIAIIAAVAIAAAAGIGLFFLPAGDRAPEATATGTPVTPPAQPTQDGLITYAASRFDDGQAQFFHYADPASRITINYFIIKSSDGVIRAAFDACDVCWPAGKGYVQEGDSMVCRNCGRRFASTMVNEVAGGCNPAPLERDLQGDRLVIRVDDLLKGRSYFDFSKKA